jgi:radical SAM superfamily enzyme YgiQ (UPF0313 family)
VRITLIQPAMGREREGFVESWKMEPLAIAVLASLTPRRHELTFFDDRVEAIDYDHAADLVAITVEAYTARRAYQVAAHYRRRGVPVVMGGYQATLAPDEVARYADAICVGEAEGVWHAMLDDAEAGRLQERYQAARPALSGVRPDRSIFADKRYMPLTLVESGRGCKFKCDFCSIASYFDQSFRARPGAEVAAEIERTGRKRVFLVDDNLTADFARAKELLRELTPLNITWMSQATINSADDPELVSLMAKSGCTAILIGFESLGEDTLAAMNKGFNRGASRFSDSLARLRDAGIKVYATFVFGYDTDTPDLFERTLDFAMRQKFFVTAFNHMQPFPGTPLYRRMEEEGRLIYDRWWLEPSYRFGQIVFDPRSMSRDELYERLRETRQRYFSLPSIAQRATDLRANLASPESAYYYFFVNWILRKELNEKWVTPLGDLSDPISIEPI